MVSDKIEAEVRRQDVGKIYDPWPHHTLHKKRN